MEKQIREDQELNLVNGELRALVEFLQQQKKWMNNRRTRIFIIDLQEYIQSVQEFVEEAPVPKSNEQNTRLLDGLLTQESELLRQLSGETASSELIKLQLVNQLLLEDNLLFQSAIASSELANNAKTMRPTFLNFFRRERR